MFCFCKKPDAQCATPITVFPYTEGFETTNGGFTTGGTLATGPGAHRPNQ